MKLIAQIMENTQAYRLWQAPFADEKFAPVAAHNDLSRVRRVLDVGCGPGTNTQHFSGADYLGIDRNAGSVVALTPDGVTRKTSSLPTLPPTWRLRASGTISSC